MEISFVNNNFSDNIDEAISFAKKNNLKYIEIENINGKNITEHSFDELVAISSKISSQGLLVSCISTPFLKWKTTETNFKICGQHIDSEEEYFTNIMDIADIFGAPSIRIFSYLKTDISIEDLAQKLDVYSQQALNRGIELLLENDGLCNIDTIHNMHQLFELYSFSNIFPLLNLGTTITIADNFNPQELQDLINNCQYFHLKDYDSELKRNVVIGEGDVDYETILADKINDNSTFVSLDPSTGYPEDLQMSLNMLMAIE